MLTVQKNQLHFVTVTEVKVWNSSNEVKGRIIFELVSAVLTYDVLVIVVSYFIVWCLFFGGGGRGGRDRVIFKGAKKDILFTKCVLYSLPICAYDTGWPE